MFVPNCWNELANTNYTLPPVLLRESDFFKILRNRIKYCVENETYREKEIFFLNLSSR